MSRKDVVVIASRALSVFSAVFALGEVSYLPEFLHSYLRYADQATGSSAYLQYLHHYYLLRIGFLITRIIGYFLLARWLHKGGPGVQELLLPTSAEQESIAS